MDRWLFVLYEYTVREQWNIDPNILKMKDNRPIDKTVVIFKIWNNQCDRGADNLEYTNLMVFEAFPF